MSLWVRLKAYICPQHLDLQGHWDETAGSTVLSLRKVKKHLLNVLIVAYNQSPRTAQTPLPKHITIIQKPVWLRTSTQKFTVDHIIVPELKHIY
jgi:hypothetical protein